MCLQDVVRWMVVLRELSEHIAGQLTAVVCDEEVDELRLQVVEGRVHHLDVAVLYVELVVDGRVGTQQLA